MLDYIYLHVLFLGQRHISCLFLGDLFSIKHRFVCYNNLDARLVMQVLHESFTFFGSHHNHPVLKSRLASEEILHIDAMYPLNISRMSNECNALSNVVRGRLTRSSTFTRSALLGNCLPTRSLTSSAMT
jgi:hypothetical protein